MYPLIGFIFLFLTLQNVFMSFEVDQYIGKFITDAQKERLIIFYENGTLNYKLILTYFIVYFCCLLLFYIFILKRKGSLFEAFLLGSAIYAIPDIFIFGIFNNTNISSIPTLVYDIFIVGGINYSLMTYIYYTYPIFLQQYSYLFVITFILSLVYGINRMYRLQKLPYNK